MSTFVFNATFCIHKNLHIYFDHGIFQQLKLASRPAARLSCAAARFGYISACHRLGFPRKGSPEAKHKRYRI